MEVITLARVQRLILEKYDIFVKFRYKRTNTDECHTYPRNGIPLL